MELLENLPLFVRARTTREAAFAETNTTSAISFRINYGSDYLIQNNYRTQNLEVSMKTKERLVKVGFTDAESTAD